jgi:hypothetical protein
MLELLTQKEKYDTRKKIRVATNPFKIFEQPLVAAKEGLAGLVLRCLGD